MSNDTVILNIICMLDFPLGIDRFVRLIRFSTLHELNYLFVPEQYRFKKNNKSNGTVSGVYFER